MSQEKRELPPNPMKKPVRRMKLRADVRRRRSALAAPDRIPKKFRTAILGLTLVGGALFILGNLVLHYAQMWPALEFRSVIKGGYEFDSQAEGEEWLKSIIRTASFWSHFAQVLAAIGLGGLAGLVVIFLHLASSRLVRRDVTPPPGMMIGLVIMLAGFLAMIQYYMISLISSVGKMDNVWGKGQTGAGPLEKIAPYLGLTHAFTGILLFVAFFFIYSGIRSAVNKRRLPAPIGLKRVLAGGYVSLGCGIASSFLTYFVVFYVVKRPRAISTYGDVLYYILDLLWQIILYWGLFGVLSIFIIAGAVAAAWFAMRSVGTIPLPEPVSE